ncbi:LacI family DNA-binding transcriptional regulator [Pelagibacterium halotolerans]|uniref:Transcriptional regulator GntR n=1 Tax=Pelagibacterium halotolerans (strain DSM 22347 / JCM 15775 / CGMCC 1.7692 / B2) TaxID=1082931 RepID=G4RAQ9_PELHB|nr:LacI family DNA-binding transcriptional regulator [Pelagibacterium halotolerans]AEQ52582.1 transcriptional regulator GntR [Pelagibacterium halotolerans B2]SEA40690.1 transcriptional regulator, LacI family [Pelagibacterium halotolerans]
MGRKDNIYRAVTLKDVAAAADVSVITASRALRTPEIVSDKVRARVQAAVDTLGYAPNQAARALASATTSTIGVLIPSVTNLVFSDVMRGIYDAVEGTPYQVQLGNTRYTNRKEEDLLKVFAAQRPAGLIVSGIDQSQTARALLESFGCPIVQIMDIGPDPIDMMIGFDHREGGRAAVRHLLEKGYRRIGFIGARMDPRAQRRLDGYSEVLHGEGLYDERLILTSPQASSVTRGSEMFADFLGMAPDADAVFCNNDDMALGALFECQRRHIRVPGQFGIMGYNDLDYTAASNPTVSSIRTLRYDMGYRAIEMIVAASKGERPEPAVVDVGYELKARQSTDRKQS